MKNTLDIIKNILSEVSGLSVGDILDDAKFSELGIDSILNAEIVAKLKNKFEEKNISSTILYENPTANDLATFLSSSFLNNIDNQIPADIPNAIPSDGDIAIIGIKTILPSGDDIYSFLEILKNGENTSREIDNSRWNHSDFYPNRIKTKWWSNVKNIKRFDAPFFNISPRQAKQMDPQERLFLETTWNALEDAGYIVGADNETCNVGVFVGITNGLYAFQNQYSWETTKQSNVASAYWSVANRISYLFNFSGPSLSIDTACSSSFSALHAAIISLRNRECDLAIVGSSNLIVSPRQMAELCDLGMLSQSDKTKAFGDNADGFVYGEAVCSFIIKRLSDSLRDNDNIYAVIAGTSIGGTGKTSGYTVPNPKAQSYVMEKAINDAKIKPEDITYIEAHGTGTNLGDPIEISAIRTIFRDNIFVGSAKSNIGHTEASSGLVGLLKVIFQLEKRTLFKSSNTDVLNSSIDWKNINVKVVDHEQKWESAGARYALINSFGAGGSNASIVVREYNKPYKERFCNKKEWLFPISAKNEESLQKQCENFLQFLHNSSHEIFDISYTLCKKRKHFNKRIIFKASHINELISKINEYLKTGSADGNNFESKIVSSSFDDEHHNALHGLCLYQFSNEEYWINYNTDQKPFGNEIEIKVNNITLCADSFFVKDHLLDGKNILPGVVHLELIRRFSNINLPFEIKNYTWVSPFIFSVTNPSEVIEISNVDDFFSLQKNGNTFSQGTIFTLSPKAVEEKVDLGEIIKLHTTYLSRDEIYRKFKTIGWEHGESLRSISFILSAENSCIASISLPNLEDVKLFSKNEEFSLNPSIMDGILQTVIGILSIFEKDPYLPFSIESLVLLAPMPDKVFAFARIIGKKNDIISYDIDVFSTSGDVILKIRSFKSKKNVISNIDKKEKIEFPERVSFYYNVNIKEDFFRIDQTNSLIVGVTDLKLKNEFHKHFPNCVFIDSVEEISSNNMSNIIDFRGLFETFPLDADSLYHYHFSFFSAVQKILKKNIKNQKWTIFFKKTPENEVFANMVVAFGKTLQKEYPGTLIEVILLDDIKDLTLIFSKSIESNLHNKHIKKFFLDKGELFSESKAPVFVDNSLSIETKIKQRGTYLISGGTGGIGLTLCEYLMKNYRANVVLLSRSKLDFSLQQRLYDLSTIYQASVSHVQCDVGNKDDAVRALEFTKLRYGKIDGIFHAAAVLKDALIFSKDPNTILPVFESKVKGALNFLNIIEEYDCDFILLFSSISSVIGGIAQSDYGAANGVLDRLATYFKKKYKQRGISTIVQSINWPYWRDGGMRIGIDLEKIMANRLGILAITNEEGMNTLECCLGAFSDLEQIVISVEDETDAFKNIIMPYNKSQLKNECIGVQKMVPEDEITNVVKLAISQIQQIEIRKIENNRSLSEYGFDSITYTELSNYLNLKLKIDTTPALFFEHDKVNSIVKYIENMTMNIENKSRNIVENEKVTFNDPFDDNQVAIIGISCRFPGAENYRDFWKNLIESKDVISIIPSDRWSWAEYFGDPTEKNKTNIKYGAFIENYARFDCDFFNIPPRYAKYMDPQQRIFLEETWKCIEDAGYNADNIAGSNIAVFVGASTYDYSKLLEEYSDEVDTFTSSGNVHCMIANQVSYFFDFHGESEAIDTACSSGLVAVHKAANAIMSKSCDMAIAGGVNLLLHPSFYISFSKAGMLSQDGKCKTFDKNADGYVRGEGCGVVLLKRLDKAIADKDYIYGIIANSKTNNNGKSNTITSPSTTAQTKLLVETYKEINISDIDFIETHGTGTAIGDIVECDALKYAFKNARKSIGLGAVKTNIGHLEPASGIASLIKVLLSLKNNIYPANMNFKNINDNLRLENSNLYLVNKNTMWESKNNKPRIAGISSFGFGGVNAHVVIKDFKMNLIDKDIDKERILVLSSTSISSLQNKASKLMEYIENEKDQPGLDSLCYTYNIGRKKMRFRVAIVFYNKLELISLLKKIINQETMQGVYWQNENYLWNTELERIAIDFVKNKEQSLLDYYSNNEFFKAPLPGHEFEGELYSVIDEIKKSSADLYAKKYEDLINDHIILGKKIVPGVVWIGLSENLLEQHSLSLISCEFFNMCSLEEFNSVRYEKRVNNSQAEITFFNENTTYSKLIFSLHENSWNSDDKIEMPTFANELDNEKIYNHLKNLDISYGKTFRILKKIYVLNENKIVGEIDHTANNINKLTILDASFQATAFLNEGIHVPATIESFVVGNDFLNSKYIVVERHNEHFSVTFFSDKKTGECKSILTAPLMTSNRSCCNKNRIFMPNLKQISLAQYNEVNHSNGIIVTTGTLDFSEILEHIDIKQVVPIENFNEKACSDINTIYIIDNKNYSSLSEANKKAFLLIKMLKIISDVATIKEISVISLLKRDKYSSILEGIMKTFMKENHFAKINVVLLEDLKSNLRNVLKSTRSLDFPNAISCIKNKFFISELKEVSFNISNVNKFKSSDTFLIIGGAGGVGSLLAKYIADKFSSNVIIAGRRNKKDIDLSKLDRSNIEYMACDITNKNSVDTLIAEILQKYGHLNGIFHSAMNLNDMSIIRMTEEDFLKGSEVKTYGTENLINATKNIDIDFIVLFSSIETFVPRAGQCNYIAGCMFQDSYSNILKNNLIKTINFGYWKNSGSVSGEDYKNRFMEEGIIGIEEESACNFIVSISKNKAISQCAIMNASEDYFTKHKDIFNLL